MKEKITVFTPTYNRKDVLVRGYEALKRQSNKNFQWLIIDDGSLDNTRSIVEKWIQEEKDFTIRYVYKENGGLHTGYNAAIANMDTELCVCVDSDDFLPDNGIELILNHWDKYGSEQYAGIIGLDFDMEGRCLGDFLPQQKTINLIDLLVGKYRIENKDRKIVVRTELYKEVAPMKSFLGEKNFNPHYMHLQISKKYDFLVLNQNLCFVDYQEDGMSANIFRQFYNSPNSFMETRALYLSFKNTSLKFIIKNAIHYCSSCFLAKKKRAIFHSPRPILTTFCAVPGFLLSCFIKRKVKIRKK